MRVSPCRTAKVPIVASKSVEKSEYLLLFVYGSLLRGERHHALMRGARFQGEVATAPGLRLIDTGTYPALVKGGSRPVQGELYLVPPRLLAELDEFEGHPDSYWRTQIRLVDGRVVDAYLMPADRLEGGVEVASGDWRLRVGSDD